MNQAKVSAVLNEWKELLAAAEKYEFMTEQERKEANKTVFDSEKFEKLSADTYDTVASYAEQNDVPKFILDLYFVIRSFSNVGFIKSVNKGALQFRTAIAAALCQMIDSQVVLDEKAKVVIFYMDENQSVVEPGYYLYDFTTFLYSFIGKENPLFK